MAKTEKVKRVYLDNASATPVDPLVKDAMAPFWSRGFGNPGAVYKEGVIAKKRLKIQGEKLRGCLSAVPTKSFL